MGADEEVVPASEYRALQQWCERTGVGLGRLELSPQDVMHALVLRLLVDPVLAADLAADLREGSSSDAMAAYVCW